MSLSDFASVSVGLWVIESINLLSGLQLCWVVYYRNVFIYWFVLSKCTWHSVYSADLFRIALAFNSLCIISCFVLFWITAARVLLSRSAQVICTFSLYFLRVWARDVSFVLSDVRAVILRGCWLYSCSFSALRDVRAVSLTWNYLSDKGRVQLCQVRWASQ